MSGAALSTFNDFYNETTGPAILGGPDTIINDAQLRNYELYKLMGRAKKDVQGGSTIKDQIMFQDSGQAENYHPGESAAIANVQVLDTITVPWRFTRVPITWTEKEILLNEGGANSQFHQYKKLIKSKWQAAYTSLLNRMERNFAVAASNATMEAATGKAPYSIFATVTTDGLAPSGFTTVQGVNPTTESKWRNQTANYTAATPFDVDNGIVAGFDNIAQTTVFSGPGTKEEYFTNSKFSSKVILTNREGRRDYMKALRANNDITRVGAQDPSYGEPVFDNIPVKAAEAFDDQATWSSGSPGFLFLDMEFIKLVVYTEKWLDKTEPERYPDKPDTWVSWVDAWYNVFNCSRQRHGYLSAV